MKVLALVAFCLALSACTTTPPASQAPCSMVGYCDNLSVQANRGIPVSRTVQVMVHRPTLINGSPVDPGEWPASVYAKSADGSACSATIVGERVVFMAGHCMPNGGAITFTGGANQYKARCTHQPEYKDGKGNETADRALCLVDRPVTGIPFESLGITEPISIGQTILLSGYGCINKGGGGGNDGIFRTGNAVVRGLPNTASEFIVTEGGAALCFGDSGGAAFVVKGTNRVVVAGNSQGDIESMSYLSAVASKSFTTWVSLWAKASNNVRICGVHQDALGCRTGEAAPQPDGKFEVQGRAACVRGVVKPDYLSNKAAVVESVRKALEQ